MLRFVLKAAFFFAIAAMIVPEDMRFTSFGFETDTGKTARITSDAALAPAPVAAGLAPGLGAGVACQDDDLLCQGRRAVEAAAGEALLERATAAIHAFFSDSLADGAAQLGIEAPRGS